MQEVSRKKMIVAIYLALAAGTIVLYCPVLWHGFTNYDDPDYLLNNAHVNAGLTCSGIVWAFKSAYAANWHPLTWMSHMLDCQLFGINHPGAHHLMNVLFHAANALLLFILLNYMTGAKWRSFFVAALFAWHPLHVESVAWASERKDVLSGFFWMLTLLCYAHYARGFAKADGRWKMEDGSSKPAVTPSSSILNPRSSAAFYLLALLFFACGVMSKPMVVTLPCVLLLLDFWPLQRLMASGAATASTLQRLLLEKLPFFTLAAASCAITLLAQHNAMWSSGSLPFGFRVANTLMAYVRYLSKIFLPIDLALIYPYPHAWPLVGVVAAGAVLLALTVVFVFQAKRFPYLAVGWFWFLGTLVPVIGLVQVGVQSMADRYTYLPSIGIFIVAAWGISDLVGSSLRKSETCAITGGCALIACLVLTFIQLRYWRNDISLFTHTVLVTTDNYAAYDCLGKSWQQRGNLDRANQCYEEAVQLEPDYPLAQFDLGMNLVSLGDPAGASNHLATAVQLWPGSAVAQYDFGVFLLQHGQAQDAAAHLKAALAIQPDFPEAEKELNTVEALKR
jgi:tetratricopeptide (TPR) repeat protein